MSERQCGSCGAEIYEYTWHGECPFCGDEVCEACVSVRGRHHYDCEELEE